jgi:hypothetical protein
MTSSTSYGFETQYSAGEDCPEKRPWGLRPGEKIPFDETKDDSKPFYNFPFRDQILSSSFITIFF